MTDSILINGQASRHIDAMDRGFLYGDGIFETVRIRHFAPVFWAHHVQRLQQSCQRLKLRCPDVSLLESELHQLIQDSEGVVRITLSRGVGPRGYRPLAEHSTRVLAWFPAPQFSLERYTQGVSLRWCGGRLGRNPLLAGIKHLNRLEQVLARAEWDDEAIHEGLLQDSSGEVIEGTMSNVFLVQQGVLITPRLDQCGVAGVMRAVILEQAEKLGLACEVRAVSVDEVEQADECFISNSTIGIWPVRALATRQWRTPGKITQRLQQAVQKLWA
jgi:4-amino-4-deoxychorismate lyase